MAKKTSYKFSTLDAMPTDAKCSKCEGNLDTAGFPKWCRKCRAAYKREYEALKSDMAETRGFAAGVSAMRAYLAERFAPYTSIQRFTGPEIAGIIRDCQGPSSDAP